MIDMVGEEFARGRGGLGFRVSIGYVSEFQRSWQAFQNYTSCSI